MDENSIIKKYPNYQFIKYNLRERDIINKTRTVKSKHTQMQVQQVIEENSCNHFVEFKMQLPEEYPFYDLVESKTEIKDLTNSIMKNTIFISGSIHKRIHYITLEGNYNYENENLKYYIGDLKILCTNIPFNCSVKIPDIHKMRNINIEITEAESSNVIDIPDDPLILGQESASFYKSIKEMLIVNIKLRVLKSVEASF